VIQPQAGARKQTNRLVSDPHSSGKTTAMLARIGIPVAKRDTRVLAMPTAVVRVFNGPRQVSKFVLFDRKRCEGGITK